MTKKVMVLSESATHKHLILPTEACRQVYLRAVRRRKVKWNYAVYYKDTQGFGLQLAIADWVTECGPNATYIH